MPLRPGRMIFIMRTGCFANSCTIAYNNAGKEMEFADMFLHVRKEVYHVPGSMPGVRKRKSIG